MKKNLLRRKEEYEENWLKNLKKWKKKKRKNIFRPGGLLHFQIAHDNWF